MYRLEFLPVARQDLIDIVRYVSQELQNPTAAERLGEKILDAAQKVLAFPYARPAYIPIRPLKHEYRKISVENYLMFYWVDEDQKLVTIARVLYGKRDCSQLIN